MVIDKYVTYHCDNFEYPACLSGLSITKRRVLRYMCILINRLQVLAFFLCWEGPGREVSRECIGAGCGAKG